MDSKTKILVVETDTPLAMMMVSLLAHAGCDVMVANTGEKGMELAQENKFDLIVLDMDFPDISGFEVCSKLKERHLSRHTPTVFISRQLNEEGQQHGLDLGAVECITKPLDPSAFVRRILALATPKVVPTES